MNAINHNDDATTVGQRIILPSSIYGSPRWYAQAYQDSIATVRKYGKPTIFITYSCNPKCKEIKKSLLPGQTSQDRPDIVCRVYKMQVREIMKDIVAKQAFGKVTSYTVVVEFQKRGLPHTIVGIGYPNFGYPRVIPEPESNFGYGLGWVCV